MAAVINASIAARVAAPKRVAARRTFFGKGVAGIAPVRYV